MRWWWVLGLVACDGAAPSGDDTDTEPTVTPTFSADVLPMLNRSCADAGCHGSVPFGGGLDLTPANAHLQLVGTASQGLPSMPRVAAGDPDNSFLVYKIAGRLDEVCEGGCGDAMPPPYGMTTDEVATITAWIAAGANDD